MINATNPTGKVLEVIPVMRSDAVSLAFHDSLVEAAVDTKGVRLTTPVMYDASEYPKSDAFKVSITVSQFSYRVTILDGKNLPVT